MSATAISVDHISKQFRIGMYGGTKGTKNAFLRVVTSPFRYLVSSLSKPSDDELFWALQDVSFRVNRGEVLGVIGKNGAGKSTLLKILSRIMEPTEGRAIVQGRIGSLLEVGTGFHPELTGRENIYLNGAIMGMKKPEINRKFDEIVDFSGVGKFIDTPVKRYSSGMYVRLAFSVAAHLEPEILMIDEVLAVGDADFQKKCLGKMENVAKEGRTILFVSHNLTAVQSLCHRVIWLDHGKLVEQGPSANVISHYLGSSPDICGEHTWDDKETAPGNDKVRLRRLRIYPENGTPSDLITMQTPVIIDIEYWNLAADANLCITLHMYSEQQSVAFTTGSVENDPEWHGKRLAPGLYRSRCFIPGNLLNSGQYRAVLLVVENFETIIFNYDDSFSFTVSDVATRPGGWYGREPGLVHPLLKWQTEAIP